MSIRLVQVSLLPLGKKIISNNRIKAGFNHVYRPFSASWASRNPQTLAPYLLGEEEGKHLFPVRLEDSSGMFYA